MNKPVVVLRTVEKVKRIIEVMINMPHLHSGFPVVTIQELLPVRAFVFILLCINIKQFDFLCQFSHYILYMLYIYAVDDHNVDHLREALKEAFVFSL